MTRIVFILSIGLLTACAKREEQPQQTPVAQTPEPVVTQQQSPVSKFKGLEVKKPIQIQAPNNAPIPAASGAADAK